VIVLMIRIIMAVGVRVASSVRVHVFVLVKDDLKAAPERIGDAAQRGEAWDVIAALQARDHRLGHGKPLRELLLRLTCVGTKLEQTVGALGGDDGAVVTHCCTSGASDELFHVADLARLRSGVT
jgi:hypothetical protein